MSLTMRRLAPVADLLHLLGMNPIDERLLPILSILIAAAEEALMHDDFRQHSHVDLVPLEQALMLIELPISPPHKLAERLEDRLEVEREVGVRDAQ